MAVQNPPTFIQAGSHTAEDLRRFNHALFEGRTGIYAAADFAVTENGTPNMTVNVAAGRGVTNGSESSFQGAYFIEARTTTNVAINAADPTNPRKDLIVAKVQDAAYSGATNAWSLVAVAGTAAGVPAEPTPPANCIVLAMVDVPAASTTVINARITDRRHTTNTSQGRISALGGVIVCTSTTRPTHLAGRVIYETDTALVKTSNGAAWASVVASGAFSIVRKTADESLASNIVLQNDDHLVIAVNASTNYVVEGWIACSGNTGAAGPNIRMGFTGPVGATMRWGYHAEDQLAAGGATWSTTIGGPITITGPAGWASDQILIFIQGLLSVSTTAGNLQLQWAQTSSSVTSTSVLQGSALRISSVT